MTYKKKWPQRTYLGLAGRERAALAEKNSRPSLNSAASRKKKSSPKRSTITRSKSWLKPRTAKRAAEEAIYRRLSRAWIQGKKCAVFPAEWATQCHHIFGRRGKLLLWEHGWMAVSARGHEWINSNPARAREKGFLAPVGKYNDQSLVTNGNLT